MTKGKIFVRKKKEEIAQESATPEVIKQDTEHPQDDNLNKKTISNIYKATYEQIYAFLLSLFSGNKVDLQKILKLAKIMLKEGVRTPEIEKLVKTNKRSKDKKSKDKNIVQNINKKQTRSR